MLHIAALQLRPRCVKLLLRHNAQILIKSHDGQDPISNLDTKIKSFQLGFNVKDDRVTLLQKTRRAFMFNGIIEFRSDYVTFTLVSHERPTRLMRGACTWNGIKETLITLQGQYEALHDNLSAMKWINVSSNDVSNSSRLFRAIFDKSFQVAMLDVSVAFSILGEKLITSR